MKLKLSFDLNKVLLKHKILSYQSTICILDLNCWGDEGGGGAFMTKTFNLYDINSVRTQDSKLATIIL